MTQKRSQMHIEDIPTLPEQKIGHAPWKGFPPLRYGVGWHSGRARRHRPNEDSVLTFQGTCTYRGELVGFGLFLVADGMGGHAYGDEASCLALQTVLYTVLPGLFGTQDLHPTSVSDILIGSIQWANRSIYQRAHEHGVEMGSTITAVLLLQERAYIVNVGDSRTYLLRGEKPLVQVTRDHSLVATLVSLGEIRAEEVYVHPERNKIYRSLGIEMEVEVDCFVVNTNPGDIFLLCSDGLWETLRDPYIELFLRKAGDLQQASKWFVEAALKQGGPDNISVVLVEVPGKKE